MGKPLRVLIIEDSQEDTQLLLRELKRSGYEVEFERVDTAAAMQAVLTEKPWDLILSDYTMPRFNAPQALDVLKASRLDLPFIIISGTIGEETAVAALKAGANNYLFKGNLAKLGQVIDQELREAEIRREGRQVQQAEESPQAKNEELKAMSQELWQTTKLATIGELAASIAHELENRLATVSLSTEMLLGQFSPEDSHAKSLQIIGAEVKRMSTLVVNLLQFSSRSATQISTMDVREEIVNTLELIHYHLHKQNILTVQEFSPETPLIQVDRQQLQQVFLNLFTNAADAMPLGGRLTVRTGPSESAALRQTGPLEPQPAMSLGLPVSKLPQVLVEVSDTGDGIPPEKLTQVWEPFYTTKLQGKGTGLGLALCRRIIQENGGTIEIISDGIPGKGTTVRIALPAIKV